MILILFFYFSFSIKDDFKRSLPKHYLLEDEDDSAKVKFYNYFSFKQIENETVRDKFLGIKRNFKNETNVEENYKLLKELADEGEYSEPYFFLAMIHHLGLYNFPVNDTLSRSYLEIGASKNDQASISYLAIFCRFGIGGPEDIPRAIALDFTENMYGKLAIGFYFRFGFYLPSSCSSSFQRLIYVSERSLTGFKRFETEEKYSEYIDRRKLPEQSEKKSQGVFQLTKQKALDGSLIDTFILGIYYYRGMIPGGRPNYEAAMKCFNYTLKHGIPESKGFIGHMIFNGFGVPADKEKALKYIEEGAKEGDLNSMNMLGIFHLTNMIDNANKTVGLNYLTLASLKGHIQSKMMLGVMSLSGEDPITYNAEKGYKLIKISAKNKMPQACLYHAYLKFHGIGTKRNCRSALKRIYRFLPDFPVFKDNMKKAYYAMAADDYEYALKMNTHMAHWGNRNAAHSGLIAADFLKKNATKLIEILAAFGDGEAILRILGQNNQTAKIESDEINRTELLLEAANSNSEGAFQVAWLFRNNLTMALEYLTITEKHADRVKPLTAATRCILYLRALARMVFLGEKENAEALQLVLHNAVIGCCLVCIYLFVLLLARALMKNIMKNVNSENV